MKRVSLNQRGRAWMIDTSGSHDTLGQLLVHLGVNLNAKKNRGHIHLALARVLMVTVGVIGVGFWAPSCLYS
jgi:hypothetical protein